MPWNQDESSISGPDLLMNTLESFSGDVDLVPAKVLRWSQIEFTFTEGLSGERHRLGRWGSWQLTAFPHFSGSVEYEEMAAWSNQICKTDKTDQPWVRVSGYMDHGPSKCIAWESELGFAELCSPVSWPVEVLWSKQKESLCRANGTGVDWQCRCFVGY